MSEVMTRGNFSVTKHAIERAVERLGIKAVDAASYLNQLMQTAMFVESKLRDDGKTSRTYFHTKTDTRIVVNGSSIVTVYQRPGSTPLDTRFLRPVLDRELRKMRREHTRHVRQVELDHAMTLRKYADMAINYAKARNPKTRDLISDRMTELKAVADGYMARIERMEDEYAAKVRAVELIAE